MIFEPRVFLANARSSDTPAYALISRNTMPRRATIEPYYLRLISHFTILLK